jgi:hypothetical protein
MEGSSGRFTITACDDFLVASKQSVLTAKRANAATKRVVVFLCTVTTVPRSKSHILVTTKDSTRISNAIEERRAERLAMDIEDKATRDKQTEQTMAMLKNAQQTLTNSNCFQGPPSSFNPIQPQQQFEHQGEPMMTNSKFQFPRPAILPSHPTATEI